tara:strand:+ start:1734 stop:2165 length:432 start_codon:yes stop_codon:yes gene_type:complete
MSKYKKDPVIIEAAKRADIDLDKAAYIVEDLWKQIRHTIQHFELYPMGVVLSNAVSFTPDKYKIKNKLERLEYTEAQESVTYKKLKAVKKAREEAINYKTKIVNKIGDRKYSYELLTEKYEPQENANVSEKDNWRQHESNEKE